MRTWIVLLSAFVAAMVSAPGAWGASFSLTGPLGTARDSHTATLLQSGKVFVAGGANNSTSQSASTELFDPASGTWSAGPSLKAARAYHTATLLTSGKVLVAGGANAASAELYDPVAGSTAITGSMTASRSYHTATLLNNGKVLIAGGLSSGGDLATAELFDPASGTFTATGSMTSAREGHSATLLADGTVLIVGGTSNGTPFRTAMLYNPSTGTFSNLMNNQTVVNMASARSMHTATLLSSGKVLVAGGYNGTADLASAELITVTGTSSSVASTGSMAVARESHAATLLNDGKVLVSGGWSDSGAALSEAELYDPAAGTFSAISGGMLGGARAYHTSTMLSSGSVLLAGGYDGSLDTASAEIYQGAAGGGGSATTASISAPASTYGDNVSITVTVSAASSAPTGSVTLSMDGSQVGSQTLSNSGTNGVATFSVTKPAAGDHTLSAVYAAQSGFSGSIGSGTLSVAQRPITVSADSTIKAVGAADPPLTYQITSGSLAAGENLTGNLTRVAGETIGSYAIQQGTLTGGSNYLVSFVGATLTIATTVCANAPSDLVAWWRGENNGSDSIGTSNGTLMNGTSFSSGEVGQAFSFNGVNQYVNIPHTSALNVSTSLTLSAWVKHNVTTAGGGLQDIIKKGTFGFYFDSNGQIKFNLTTSTSGLALASGIIPVVGQWYHLVGTYDGAYQRIYVNGVLAASSPMTGSVTSTTALTLGFKTASNSTYLNGALDEVQLYTRGLTQAEVEALYAAHDAGTCTQIPPNPTTASISASAISYGSDGSVTVTVSSASGTPTGSVALSVDGGPELTQPLSPASTGTATATFTITKPQGGSHTLSANYYQVQGSFAGSWATATLTVAKSPATLSLGNLSHTYDATPRAASAATSPSGLSVIYTYNGSSTPPTAAGSYTVVATVVDASYQGSATGTLVVAKRPLNVTGSGRDKTYDGTTSATVYFSHDAIPADGIGVSGNASFSDKRVGTGKTITVTGLTAGGSAAVNYTLVNSGFTTSASILAAHLAPYNIVAADKTYDGTTAVSLSGGALSGIVPGDSVGFTGLTGWLSSAKNIANGVSAAMVNFSLTLTGTDAANYVVDYPTITSIFPPKVTVQVFPKPITVTGLSALNKVYDRTTAATLSGGTLSGVLPGDVVGINGQSGSFADKNVGNGMAVTVTGTALTGTDAYCYTLTPPTGITANITQRSLTVTATGQDKAYDGRATATVTLTDNRVAGDALALAYTSANFNNKNIGVNKTVSVSGISISGTDAGNYALSSTAASTTASITAKLLSVTLTGVAKVYDGTTAATVSYGDNRSSGDQITLTGTAVYADKNVGIGKTVTVTGITLGGTDAGNYTLSTTSGSTTADITARPLTLFPVSINKVYDGTTSANMSLSDDRVPGDVMTLSYSGANFDTKNIGTGKPVTVTGITKSGADSGNYTVPSSASTTASITAKGLSVTGMTANNKVYDGTTAATLSGGTLSGVVAGEVVTFSGQTGSFADKKAGTAKPVTVTGIVLSGADAANYTVTNPSGLAANITAKLLTVTGMTATSRVYNGSAVAALSGGTLSGVLGSDAVSFSGQVGAFADKRVGTAKPVTVTGIILSGADAANYTVANPTGLSADITARTLTVTATAQDKVYNGNTAATVTLGDNRLAGDLLSAAYTSAVFSNKNVGVNKTVTVSGIWITGTDAANYTLASTSASASASITPKVFTVSATGVNKVYDGTSAASVIFTDNRTAGDSITITGTATFSDKNVGTAKTVTVTGLTVTGADAANYNLTVTTTSATADITPRSLTVTASAQNKVYDGSTTASATLSDNRIAGDLLTLAFTGANFSTKTVGTGKTVTVTGITKSGADAGNYTVSTSASTTASITAKGIGVIGMSANNKVYDGTTLATLSGGTLSGVVAGDAVSFSGQTGAFADKKVGTAKPVTVTGVALSGVDAGNYTVSNPTGLAANITAKALTVTGMTATSRVYNGTTAAALSGGALSGVIGGDVVGFSGQTGAFAEKKVGTAKPVTVSGIVLSGADAANYTVANPAGLSADITPATLTVTATGQDRVYNGGTVATVTLSDNRIAGDVLTASYASASFSNKNVGNNKPVSVSGISISGSDAANYTLASTTASTTASISAKSFTVTAVGANKVYDGTTAASVGFTDNRAAGDVITISGTATFSDKNVGTAKTVSVTGITVTGTDAANYSLASSTASTTADITARTLTAGATAQNKVYDGTTAATVTLTDNRVAGDLLTLGKSAATFDTKTVGTGKTVTISGITKSGTDAGNYTLASTSVTTTASITAKALTVTGMSANNKVYDGTTAATLTGGSLSGVVSGDAVTFSGQTGSFADKKAGTAKPVTVAGIVLSGTDAGNYTVSNPTGLAANITAKGLTVTGMSAANKVYNGNTVAALSGGTLSGVLGSDAVSFAGQTGAFADKRVGTAKPVTVTGITLSGADGANYSVTNPTGLAADITAATLTVSATGVDRAYNGTTAASVNLTDNRIAGDLLTVSYGSAAFADKKAGTGKTVSVTGIAVSGTDAGNYTLAATALSTTASITGRPLNVTCTVPSKVYDGSTAASVSFGDDRASGDVFTLSGTAAFADKNVGTGKTVTVTGIAATGTDAANYTVAGTGTTSADITRKTLTVTADNKSRYTDTPDPLFTYTLAGFVAGENASLVSGAPVFSTTATSASPAGSYPITPTLGTLSATNYSFSFVNGVLTVNQHYTLTIDIVGGGTVNNFNTGSPAFTPCSAASCSAGYDPGSVFTLRASPAVSFTGWTGGGCTSGDCQVTLNANTSITATFATMVKLTSDLTPYQSLQGAYDAATAQSATAPVLLARGVQLDGDFTLYHALTLVLQGGYGDSAFSTQSGYTAINGHLKVSKGKLVPYRLYVR